ncbi:MAG TPA: protein kinase [Pyrinomonadaceae bacterium]|jgi:serine/threonine-protein kinase|nr:protein kinase [Pyrinomonadaceae bacterium]
MNPDSTSETISHYRIIRKLDRGGMGEVYLAEDARLGRPLALKLLLAEYTRDPARLRRFEQEARAASALNHPNILTIYEVGEAGERHYIATEYVEGETLRRKIKRAPLLIGEAIDIAAQAAEALSAAHAAGIVHRDIKPENIMVRPDGYVKVLDFGLAKLVERRGAGGEAETQMAETNPGVVMGTTWYMSPEQARGQKVDARTDVWSLGVVLYEMLAGNPPFVGSTSSHVIVSILESEPPPLEDFLPDAPSELESIIAGALAKDRDARYPSMSEMLEDLLALRRSLGAGAAMRAASARLIHETAEARGDDATAGNRGARATAVSTGGDPDSRTGAHARATQELRFDTSVVRPAARSRASVALVAGVIAAVLLVGAYVLYTKLNAARGINAIAVMPFRNASGDPSTEWLSDGITESLINSLSPSPGLKVMSRNSVFRYKGKEVDPAQVARELGVSAVLTGEVAQRGEDLLVSVELIDARDNSHIWGEQYKRKLSDVLGVQEDIAREIASRLRARLQPGAAEPKVYTHDGEAYQDYLRGRYFWNKRTEDGFRRAVGYFNQAIERDPSYALAYSGLADTYALMSDYSITPPNEAMLKARAAAERALALDDTLAEAHTSLAFVRMAYDWKWDEAGEEFRRAIELNPNYATAHQWYASYLVQVGRFGEALSEIRHAQELDPLSSIISANAGLYLYYAQQYEQATAQLRKTLEVNDQFGVAHLYLGYIYLRQSGHAAEAVNEFQKALDTGEDPETLAALGNAYAAAGRRADAQKVLEQLRERSQHGYVSPYWLAVIHAGLGDRERAFDSLERAYQDRHPGMILVKYDPRFDPLRSDPRFTRLIRRIEEPS